MVPPLRWGRVDVSLPRPERAASAPSADDMVGWLSATCASIDALESARAVSVAHGWAEPLLVSRACGVEGFPRPWLASGGCVA